MSVRVGDYLIYSLLYVDGCHCAIPLNADLICCMFILKSNKDFSRVDTNCTCSGW